MFVRLFVILVLLAPAHTYAGEAKNFSIGFGTYALVVAYNNDNYVNDELAGLSVSASYAFSDNVGMRGTYYSLDHNDIAALDDSGYDFIAYIGDGLQSRGFKVYVGGGIFNESWEIGDNSESFRGLQISGGLGYNWDSVALDFVLSLREPGDYEDVIFNNIGDSVNAAAASGGLIISARF